MSNIYLEDKKFEDQGSVWPFLKRIFSYSLRHKKLFYSLMASVILVGITDALWPILWMYFIDGNIVPMVEQYGKMRESGLDYTIDTSGLKQYFFIFFGNGVIQVIGVFAFIYCAGKIGEYVLYDLRNEMFKKLQKLSYSFYDKSALGWLLSRLSSDSDRVAELISWGFLDFLWGVTMIIACFAMMFIYNWKLALIVAVSLPILAFTSVKLRMLILKYSRKSRKINSELTATFTEHINGVEVNKITAQESRVSGEFRGLSNRMRRVTFKSSFYTAMYMPIVIFIGALTAIFVINVGGRMAIALPTGITVGVLAAFFGYATRIFEPIMDITRFYAMAQNSLSAGERIFGLIDEIPEIADKEGAKDYEKVKGDIRFDSVTFEYVEGKPILENFNLHILPGQSVALVGATGDGKTTISNLVGRFYEPVKGTLYVDGIDYRDMTLNSLRKQMGIVLQTPHLFKGSVLENLIYANQDASIEMVGQTLKKIGAEHFLERLQEDVGENGDNFSLGEKQLISFARAIIADPAILIMDEATSSVDTQTEMIIQNGISEMINNRTSIIIAHRLSTIKNCDRILVIKKGKIIEDGSHNELMKQGGKYHELYTKQLRVGSEEEAMA